MRIPMLFLVILGLAWAAVSVSPSLPATWPEGTAFALVDAEGHVVWQPGGDLIPKALQQAAFLLVTLPDGTAYQVPVVVEGKGKGLGEVKLSVEGKLVPLPELLRARGFALEDGHLVRIKPEKGPSEDGGGHREDQGKASPAGRGWGHGR